MHDEQAACRHPAGRRAGWDRDRRKRCAYDNGAVRRERRGAAPAAGAVVAGAIAAGGHEGAHVEHDPQPVPAAGNVAGPSKAAGPDDERHGANAAGAGAGAANIRADGDVRKRAQRSRRAGLGQRQVGGVAGRVCDRGAGQGQGAGAGVAQGIRSVAPQHRVPELELGVAVGAVRVQGAARGNGREGQQGRARHVDRLVKGHRNADRGAGAVLAVGVRRKDRNHRGPHAVDHYAARAAERVRRAGLGKDQGRVVAGRVPDGGAAIEDQGAGAAVL